MENQINELLGVTLVKIEGCEVGKDEIIFHADDGRSWRMFHLQGCCESVQIEDVAGDIADLIGSPITMAEEVVSADKNPEGVNIPEYQDSFTWTFYKLATVKGYVTIRWYGESNGYYSEEVDFESIETKG